MTQEAKERRQRAEAETAAAGGVSETLDSQKLKRLARFGEKLVGKVWGKIQSRRNENRV